MPLYLHLHVLPQVGIILLLFTLTRVLHLTKLQVQLTGSHLEGAAGALFSCHIFHHCHGWRFGRVTFVWRSSLVRSRKSPV